MAENHQSQYTGAQLDAAIAAYQNRSAGTIGLNPDRLSGSLGSGYYSGVSASFDPSSLLAMPATVLEDVTAIGKTGKIKGTMKGHYGEDVVLNPNSPTKVLDAGYYGLSCRAVFDSSSLTATAADVAAGKTAMGTSGKVTGTMNAPQVFTFEASSNISSKTITGVQGTPTNMIIARGGWQGVASYNTATVLRFICIPGTADKFHYTIAGSNTYNKGSEYCWYGDTAIANCVSWNRNAQSVTINLPKYGVGDGTRNTQATFRGGYTVVVW